MSAYDEFIKHVESSSFCEKISLVKRTNEMFSVGAVDHDVWLLENNGFLKEIEHRTIDCENGDYYVYIWRHAWGDPFYVGSGKKNRWKTKNNRCRDFYLHIDMGDAVVYKVLSGVDSKTARMFEKYISINLIEAGYTLANGDNNTEYVGEDSRARRIKECKKIDNHELAGSVQNTVLSILSDRAGCDYRVTDQFLMRNGADYFSRMHIKRGRNNNENIGYKRNSNG